MKKFPIGLSTLNQLTKEGYYYVDKSRFVAELASEGKYYFLTRPRRFGKSLFIDTLKQAFLGNKAAFTGLYLERHWNWQEKYPVIHISYGQNNPSQDVQELQEAIYAILKQNAAFYGLQIEGEHYPAQFINLILQLYNKFQKHVVILIDEYDKPILDAMDDIPRAERLREILKGFYGVIKDADAYVKFTFLTGVSKFAKAGIFSGLNNLSNISMDERFAAICGITQEELEQVYAEPIVALEKKLNLTHEQCLADIRNWYNGYRFTSANIKVYNPFSTHNLFYHQQFKNYWFETGTPSFLIKLLLKNHYYLPSIETQKLTEDDLNSVELDSLPIVPLLFQSGYSTIKEVSYFAGMTLYLMQYPNQEVKMSLSGKLAAIGMGVEKKTHTLLSLYTIFEQQQFAELKTLFTALFAGIPHDWYRNNHINEYEGFYASIVYSYFSALGCPTQVEDATNQGRVDMSLELPDKIILFEFKLSHLGDAHSALEQIKQKQYAQKYLAKQKPIYLIGVSFNAEQRNVAGVEWEQF